MSKKGQVDLAANDHSDSPYPVRRSSRISSGQNLVSSPAPKAIRTRRSSASSVAEKNGVDSSTSSEDKRKTRRGSTDEEPKPAPIRSRRSSVSKVIAEETSTPNSPSRRNTRLSSSSPSLDVPAKRTRRSSQDSETVEIPARRSTRRSSTGIQESTIEEIIEKSKPIARRRRSTSIDAIEEQEETSENRPKTKRLFNEDNHLEPIEELDQEVKEKTVPEKSNEVIHSLGVINELGDDDGDKIIESLKEVLGEDSNEEDTLETAEKDESRLTPEQSKKSELEKDKPCTVATTQVNKSLVEVKDQTLIEDKLPEEEKEPNLSIEKVQTKSSEVEEHSETTDTPDDAGSTSNQKVHPKNDPIVPRNYVEVTEEGSYTLTVKDDNKIELEKADNKEETLSSPGSDKENLSINAPKKRLSLKTNEIRTTAETTGFTVRKTPRSSLCEPMDVDEDEDEVFTSIKESNQLMEKNGETETTISSPNVSVNKPEIFKEKESSILNNSCEQIDIEGSFASTNEPTILSPNFSLKKPEICKEQESSILNNSCEQIDIEGSFALTNEPTILSPNISLKKPEICKEQESSIINNSCQKIDIEGSFVEENEANISLRKSEISKKRESNIINNSCEKIDIEGSFSSTKEPTTSSPNISMKKPEISKEKESSIINNSCEQIDIEGSFSATNEETSSQNVSMKQAEVSEDGMSESIKDNSCPMEGSFSQLNSSPDKASPVVDKSEAFGKSQLASSPSKKTLASVGDSADSDSDASIHLVDSDEEKVATEENSKKNEIVQDIDNLHEHVAEAIDVTKSNSTPNKTKVRPSPSKCLDATILLDESLLDKSFGSDTAQSSEQKTNKEYIEVPSDEEEETQKTNSDCEAAVSSILNTDLTAAIIESSHNELKYHKEENSTFSNDDKIYVNDSEDEVCVEVSQSPKSVKSEAFVEIQDSQSCEYISQEVVKSEISSPYAANLNSSEEVQFKMLSPAINSFIKESVPSSVQKINIIQTTVLQKDTETNKVVENLETEKPKLATENNHKFEKQNPKSRTRLSLPDTKNENAKEKEDEKLKRKNKKNRTSLPSFTFLAPTSKTSSTVNAKESEILQVSKSDDEDKQLSVSSDKEEKSSHKDLNLKSADLNNSKKSSENKSKNKLDNKKSSKDKKTDEDCIPKKRKSEDFGGIRKKFKICSEDDNHQGLHETQASERNTKKHSRKTKSESQSKSSIIDEESEDSSDINEFIDAQAKEGEETPDEGDETPGEEEDDNEIKVVGHSVMSSSGEEKLSSDESDSNNPFIDNSGDESLLSGEEDYLGLVPKGKKRYSKIIPPADSSDSESEKAPRSSMRGNSSAEVKKPVQKKEKSCSDDNNSTVKVDSPICSTPKTVNDVMNSSVISESSLIIQEKCSVGAAKNSMIINRIEGMVNVFCGNIQEPDGDISLNVSLNYIPSQGSTSRRSFESKNNFSISQEIPTEEIKYSQNTKESSRLSLEKKNRKDITPKKCVEQKTVGIENVELQVECDNTDVIQQENIVNTNDDVDNTEKRKKRKHKKNNKQKESPVGKNRTEEYDVNAHKKQKVSAITSRNEKSSAETEKSSTKSTSDKKKNKNKLSQEKITNKHGKSEHTETKEKSKIKKTKTLFKVDEQEVLDLKTNKKKNKHSERDEKKGSSFKDSKSKERERKADKHTAETVEINVKGKRKNTESIEMEVPVKKIKLPDNKLSHVDSKPMAELVPSKTSKRVKNSEKQEKDKHKKEPKVNNSNPSSIKKSEKQDKEKHKKELKAKNSNQSSVKDSGKQEKEKHKKVQKTSNSNQVSDWDIQDLSLVQPSSSYNSSSRFNYEKLTNKDFRNRMIYDSSRNPREVLKPKKQYKK